MIWKKLNAIQSELENWKTVYSDADYIGSWAKVAVTVNKPNQSADFYLNGVKLCSGVPLGGDYNDTAYIKLGWSYWYDAPGDNCLFAVDNIISDAI